MSNLILSTKQTLIELNNVLSLIDDTQFSKPLAIFSGSSIGMHARHIITFYQCLLFQYGRGQVINYDKRKRDVLLESKREYFTLMLNVLIESLEKLDKKNLETPLSITSNFGHKNAERISSTLARELHYTLEQTIQHTAFIKIGILTLMPDAHLPKTVGISPTTLRHQKQASFQLH
jgi:hypothetical protein